MTSDQASRDREYLDSMRTRLSPEIRRAAARRGQIAWYGTLLVEHRASPAFILRALTEIADELDTVRLP